MLQRERQKASFKRKQLTKIIYPSTQFYEFFLKAQKCCEQDDVLKFNPKYIQAHRKEIMLQHARKLVRYHQNFQFSYPMVGLQTLLFSQQMPLSLHFYMFLITLNNLCTERQIQQFFKPALKCEIIGCYAQTELAHGSDIQNLMTFATYDQTTETFIIDTPEIGGTKWWIGDLGVFANHAIIFAQLVIKNKKYGLHSFLVPIRDKDHNPFPGVQVGDVGPKYGYNGKDNGYIKFDKYHIPRRNMLMKYTKVSKSGVYERRGNEKISYATMLMIRSSIPYGCFYGLSKGCLIAVRYSLYRTQFKNDKGQQIPILDYQIQQDKIITRVAQMYAIMFGARSIRQISSQVFQAAKNKNQFNRLNQIHSLASGVKAVFTTDTLNGLQTLRRGLGGHGFSYYSGLPGIIAQQSPTPTYEGQNTILYLQTARFLLKCLKYLSKGKPIPPTAAYVTEIYTSTPFVADFQTIEDVMNPENIRLIFLHHSCQSLRKLAEKMSEAISEGQNPKKVWDEKVGLSLVESGMSHTYFWIYQNYLAKTIQFGQNQPTRKVLIKLVLLYGIQKILVRAFQFYSTGVITSQTTRLLSQAKEILLEQLRPEALTLVEALEYSDNTLQSAIGGGHQKPYETLLEWAKQKNQVNKPENLQEIYKIWETTKSKLKPRL